MWQVWYKQRKKCIWESKLFLFYTRFFCLLTLYFRFGFLYTKKVAFTFNFTRKKILCLRFPYSLYFFKFSGPLCTFIYKTTTKMICNAFFTVPLFKSLISQLRWSFRLITGPPFVVTIKCNRGSITLWAIFKRKTCLKKRTYT